MPFSTLTKILYFRCINSHFMNLFRRLCFFVFVITSLALGAQEAPIQKEYVSPETEKETKSQNFLIGGGALVVLIVAFAAAKRRKNRKKNGLG